MFVTVAHHHAGLKRDAASIWLEDISLSSFKLCLRELQITQAHMKISMLYVVFIYISTCFSDIHVLPGVVTVQ